MSVENYITIIENHAAAVDSDELLDRLVERLTAASKGGTASVKLVNDTIEATILGGDGVTCTVSLNETATFVTINSLKR